MNRNNKDIPIKFNKVVKLFQFLYIHIVMLYISNLFFTMNPQIKPVIREIFHFIFVYWNFCKFFNFLDIFTQTGKYLCRNEIK